MKTHLLKRILAAALAVLLLLPMIPAQQATAAEGEKQYKEDLLPIMGWNAFNHYEHHISEDLYVRQANLLVDLGLKDVGYVYLNVDDGFQKQRLADGTLNTNYELFPHGMGWLADYAHSLGLKAGMYSDVGDNTCDARANGQGTTDYENVPATGNCLGVGFWKHEEQDMQLFFEEWGYDLVKVDWCGGQNLNMNNRQRLERYIELGQMIETWRNKLGRDIHYNVCCWTFPFDDISKDEQTVWNNIYAAEADSWRTGGDLWCNWDNVMKAINDIKNDQLWRYSEPGHYHDLDMMQIGRGMTKEEDMTHFAMWCMMSSNLVIGVDLAILEEETLEILKNTELIAIDQDPLVKCAVYQNTQNGVETWVKELTPENGKTTKAIALMNTSNTAQTVTLKPADYGLGGDITVRDLWQHKYLNVEDTITVTIPSHMTMVYKIVADEDVEPVLPVVNGTAAITFGEKETAMNLTELAGTDGDWIHFGEVNGAYERRKAGVTNPKLEYTGQRGENASNVYHDAYTSYSWSDGTDAGANGVTEGLTMTKNTVGGYGEITAVADQTERTLILPLTSWRGNLKVDIYLGNQLKESRTLEVATAADGQLRVNQQLTITYSAEEKTTLRVRWTVDSLTENRAASGCEGVVLVCPDGDTEGLYAGGADQGTNFIGGYTAKKMVKEGAKLIDVRPTFFETKEGTHIEGSDSIPNGDTFLTDFQAKYPDKDATYILYCITGKNSNQCRALLQSVGYTNIYDLGGYENWTTEAEVQLSDYKSMIFNNTKLTISQYGAERDDVEIRYSLGENSTVEDSVPYNASTGFYITSGCEVTAKAYLLFDDEVIAESSYDYLVFDRTLPQLDPATTLYLSDMTPTYTYVGNGNFLEDQAFGGSTMKIAGTTFNKGIATFAPSNVKYAVPEGATRFVAVVGMDDAKADSRGSAENSVYFTVYFDGEQSGRTVRIPSQAYYVFDLEVPEGAKEIHLECRKGPSSTHKNYNMDSEWAMAAFSFEERATSLLGDVNMDNKVNVVDIIRAKRLIMLGSWADTELNNGDLDNDGVLSVSDIMDIRELIMNG